MPDHRFVLDENVFRIGSRTAPERGADLEYLAVELTSLEDLGERIGVIEDWGSLDVGEGIDLASLLCSVDQLDRDLGLRLLILLDRCLNWDEPESAGLPFVTVDGAAQSSLGIVQALRSVAAGTGMAVVTTPQINLPGAHQVAGEAGIETIYFVASQVDHVSFFRSLYSVEDIQEREFFTLAERAFPDLIFAPSVAFGSFDGSYQDLRALIIRHLSALNDGFAVSHLNNFGNDRAISAEIGVSVSRESGHTRSSERLMKKRDVEWHGRKYRCDWHSKLQPNKNRIHFSLIEGNTIIIGLFVRHLPT